jgi:hypothetical protein
MYGREVRLLVASYTRIAYRSLPGRLVRYIIVKDPDGIYKTDYFLCTDPDLPVAEALTLYSFRWPIERAFQDCKQKLGIQDPEVQLPGSVRRCVPFGMLVYSLVVLWYLLHGHKLAASLAPSPDPWYAKTARPSFSDMIVAPRRLSWTEPFAHESSKELPIVELLAAYLARVAAAA